MSRMILQNDPQLQKTAPSRQTDAGKVIITKQNDKYLTLLIKNNRLLAASASEEEGDRIGSIYIGKIKNIVDNISACFVEILNGELVYLPLSDCRSPLVLNRSCQGTLVEGDELLVQIVREAIKTKQAAVTANISLPGELLVFSLGTNRIGISTKISLQRKKEIRELLRTNGITNETGGHVPVKNYPHFGIVVRTEAQNLSDEALLNEYWKKHEEFISFLQKSGHLACFTCVYAAAKTYLTAISRFYTQEYNEIVTDQPQILEDLKQSQIPVRLYEDASYPLMNLYGIPSKLKEAVSPRVWLKSGGYLIIEPTEALTVIDVNTGKYQGRKNMSDTFLEINLEAAEEIAIQLRLRNLSGIIIVDLISMKSKEHQDKVMQQLKNLVSKDRTKTSVIDMTPLGLVEITRKKEYKTLNEQLGNYR